MPITKHSKAGSGTEHAQEKRNDAKRPGARRTPRTGLGFCAGVFAVAVLGCVCLKGEICQAESQIEPSLIQVAEGTTPDMLSADYWLVSDALEETGSSKDTELFSPEEIEAFNRNNRPYVLYEDEMTGTKRNLFMYNLPATIKGTVVEKLIDVQSTAKLFEGEDPLYVNGTPAPEEYWPFLLENMNLFEIPETVTPRYAICLKPVVARAVPSEDFAAKDPEEIFFNSFTVAELFPMSGVAALHQSADKEWWYVISGSFCGWVRDETLAFCEDREEWLAACCPENFLVVTGRSLVLDETARPSAGAGLVLPMGTVLPLAEQALEQVNDRSSWGCFCVKIPARDPQGRFLWELALVPVSEDVSIGYLPMTSEQVIRLAFKLLGHVYGYGGSFSSNDCSGIVRQIYACFGFELPRNAKAIAKLADLGSFDCKQMTAARKKEILRDMPPGLPLFMEGHLMLYLGTSEETPYVISSCATCIEPGHEEEGIRDAYCIFVSSLNLLRRNGKSWLEDLSYMLWKEY